MPHRSDVAFVLTRYPFRERDLIVVLLTRHEGQIRVLARRARGGRHPGSGALEPLAFVRVDYFERPKSELASLDSAEALRSPFDLAALPAAWAAGQVVAELAMLYCPPGQRAEPAFRLVDRCLAALRAGQDALTVAGYAEFWFLRLAGVMPDPGRCGVCDAVIDEARRVFDAREGTFVCAQHAAGGTRLSAGTIGWLVAAAVSPIEAVDRPLPADGLELLSQLRRRFTDRDLKSWPYLASLCRATPGTNGRR